MQKKNLYIPTELVQRAEALARDRRVAFSEFLREALHRFVEESEREQMDKELAEACRNYREFNKKFAPEWSHYETRLE
jgi:predicted DNA-binding protein